MLQVAGCFGRFQNLVLVAKRAGHTPDYIVNHGLQLDQMFLMVRYNHPLVNILQNLDDNAICSQILLVL